MAWKPLRLCNHEKPHVVVHAAAMTQVDDCELRPQQCERINVQEYLAGIDRR